MVTINDFVMQSQYKQGASKGPSSTACGRRLLLTAAGFLCLAAIAFAGDSNPVGPSSVTASNAPWTTTAGGQVVSAPADSYIAPGTLAYHLSTNALARTNGITDIYNASKELSGWVYDLYNATNLARLTNSTWSTNFWLYGVRGLGATSIGFSNWLGAQGSVTMISPRHCIYATHMHFAPGYFTAAFLDTNNVIYWRTNMQNVVVTNDVSMGILDSDLPPSVGFLPVLPANYTNYLPTHGTAFFQGIGRNQDVRMFPQPMKLNPFILNWNPDEAAPGLLRTNWNVRLRGGDSSNPEMLLVGDQLVLASHNGASRAGPNYVEYFALINQCMHYLSTNNQVATDYQLTPYALTNWPAINQ